VVNKKFAFADKHRLPFVFVSASDGSNVVKVFNMAVQAGLRWRAAPKADFYQEVGQAPAFALGAVHLHGCSLPLQHSRSREVCCARLLPAAVTMRQAAARPPPQLPRLPLRLQVLQLLGQADIKPGQQLVEEDRLAKAAAGLALADRAVAAAGKLGAVHGLKAPADFAAATKEQQARAQQQQLGSAGGRVGIGIGAAF
jgi:hypothetical protein